MSIYFPFLISFSTSNSTVTYSSTNFPTIVSRYFFFSSLPKSVLGNGIFSGDLSSRYLKPTHVMNAEQMYALVNDKNKASELL